MAPKAARKARASADQAAPKLTAQDLRRMIADLHGLAPERRATMSQEWALFFELRNGTGFGRQDRYVDAFAFNLYPSKKHWRVAYEIKVSRGDFLSELRKPEKRSFGFEISNEFWYVTTPGVAKPEEIPQGCGLMVTNGSKLKRVVQAAQRNARELTMAETASIARASCRYDILTSRLWRYQDCELDEAALNELVEARKDEAFREELRQQVARDVDALTERTRESLQAYAQALKAAGVEPPAWMTPKEDELFGHWGSARSAADWVRDNVKPGPNLKEVADAMAALSAFKRTTERLTHQVTHALSELTEAADKSLDDVKKLC